VTLGAGGYQGKVKAGNIKIPAMVYAEVKPITQATAGPIYRCLGAASKTVEIAGG